MQHPPTTWPCSVPSCPAVLTSPEERAAHLKAAHPDLLAATADPLDDLRAKRRGILAQINDLNLRIIGPQGLRAKLAAIDAEIDRLMRQPAGAAHA